MKLFPPLSQDKEGRNSGWRFRSNRSRDTQAVSGLPIKCRARFVVPHKQRCHTYDSKVHAALHQVKAQAGTRGMPEEIYRIVTEKNFATLSNHFASIIVTNTYDYLGRWVALRAT